MRESVCEEGIEEVDMFEVVGSVVLISPVVLSSLTLRSALAACAESGHQEVSLDQDRGSDAAGVVSFKRTKVESVFKDPERTHRFGILKTK